MPFSNPPRSIILPADADLNDPPFIFLDGDTGTIRVVGADGSEIELNPNASLPILSFWSEDHTNRSFINLAGTGSVADLGINGGIFTGTDTVNRRHRIYMNGSGVGKTMFIACIRENNQATRGGLVRISDTIATLQYSTDAGGIQPELKMDSEGSKLNGDLFSAEYKQAAQFMGAANIASATFANFGTALSVDKQYTNTRLVLHGGVSCFANAANDQVEFQMLVNGVGHRVGFHYFNPAFTHLPLVLLGVTPTGLAAGTYSVQLQWRRVAGAQINVDGGDYLTWDLTERM